MSGAAGSGGRAEPIRVSAVVLQDESGAVLTVRKRGTTRFMLPGGKPELGESAEQAAVRECREEIGVDIDADSLETLGVFRADAANEIGRTVEATVFSYPGRVVAVHAAEIDAMRWLALHDSPAPDEIAPLLVEHVLPALRGRPRGGTDRPGGSVEVG